MIGGEEQRRLTADVLADIKAGKRAWGSGGWTERQTAQSEIAELWQRHGDLQSEIENITDARWRLLGYNDEEIAEAHGLAEQGQIYLYDWADRLEALAATDPTAFAEYNKLLTQELINHALR